MVGRKRRMTPSKIESAKQLLGGGMSPREVAHNLGVSIPTLYRWVPASSREVPAGGTAIRSHSAFSYHSTHFIRVPP
jgi:transposase-like protein